MTARSARALGLGVRLLPASDDAVRTWLDTPAGSFPFQTWFVERGHRDEVDAVRYEGAASSASARASLEALDTADVIVIAPSNPYVSIGPILAVPAIRSALETRAVPAVAVSPLVGGRAVKARPTGCSPASRRNHSRPRRLALRGADRRARLRRSRRGRRGSRRRARDHADRRAGADDGRRRPPPARRVGAGRRRSRSGSGAVRIAIVGGTGGFGRALAQRLQRIGENAVIGSRDPERARELALALGVEGGANADVVRDADLVVLSTRSNAALDTAKQLAGAIGTTPLLCVAGDLTFTADGVVPGRLRRLARRGDGGPGRRAARRGLPVARRGAPDAARAAGRGRASSAATTRR